MDFRVFFADFGRFSKDFGGFSKKLGFSSKDVGHFFKITCPYQKILQKALSKTHTCNLFVPHCCSTMRP